MIFRLLTKGRFNFSMLWKICKGLKNIGTLCMEYIEYEFFLFSNYRLRNKIRPFNLDSLSVVLNIQFENSLEKLRTTDPGELS
jgi:hypothetical protein